MALFPQIKQFIRSYYREGVQLFLSRPVNPIEQPWHEITDGFPTPPLIEENYTDLAYKAMNTIHYFKSALQTPREQQHHFAVRVRIITDKNTAEPWLTSPQIMDGKVTGIIANKTNLRRHRPGKKITLPEEAILDWMMVEDGYLLGGYSIRLGIKNLERWDRRTVYDNLPFQVDDGNDHFKHDLSTPEGALLLLGDAIDERDADKIHYCKDFYREALYLLGTTTHPSVPKPITEDMVQMLEQRLEEVFMKFNLLPETTSFYDAKRAFLYRRECPMNVWEITEIRTYYNPKFKTMHLINVQETKDGWKVLSNMNDVQLYPRPKNDKGPIIDLTGDHIKFYEDYNFPLFLKNRKKD
ncbi:hypothetical protein SAMN05444266_109106 [Chitinophaga jiangningensis]|uniref:DUF2314 domain-containing protein n=1 Tax=Chitinophaga jiangningensis TaxID=1419482 RepID=A0A1M7K1A5_9BACT|nr:DUF2314 domain-containing protein [Chitinophaga jiangningensis]SHM58984.1 hypothetical protein SAMN05444266_109106 [Chitinophaga jiangningensis]